MNVVAHQTERMDAVTEPAGPFLEKEKQERPLAVSDRRLPSICSIEGDALIVLVLAVGHRREQ